jgi:hypothetical protein
MSRLSLRLLVFLFFSLRVSAQNSNPINYPDQKPPGMVAQVFAPGIISTDAIEHSSPALSPDGKTVLWAIMKMPSYQTRLLEMNFANNKWSLPHAPSFSDTTANEVYPIFQQLVTVYFFAPIERSIHQLQRKTPCGLYREQKVDGPRHKCWTPIHIRRMFMPIQLLKMGTGILRSGHIVVLIGTFIKGTILERSMRCQPTSICKATRMVLLLRPMKAI